MAKRLVALADHVRERAEQIIGMMLVTPQTSAEGKKVHQVLIAEDVYYPGETPTSEFYMSVLLDRAAGKPMIMYSPDGGMDHPVFYLIDQKFALTGEENA